MLASRSLIRKAVIEVLEEQVPELVGITLDDSQHFGESPVNLDSLDFLQLLQSITIRLDVMVGDDQDIGNLRTLGSLVNCLTELCEQK